MYRRKEAGFHLIALLLGLVVVGVVGFVGWKVYDGQDKKQAQTVESVSCSVQPVLASPAELSLATAVLYPGQVRGGDYKPHGGLRFDKSKNEDIKVTAPTDSKLISGSRYIEQGEVQTLLEFNAACDVKYRLDHLLSLSNKIQQAVDKNLPAAKPDDSRTTEFDSPVEIKKGEVIATAVGFKQGPNVSFDFGVYDYRKSNGIKKANNSYTEYGVCWFDLLPSVDAAKVRSLPAGDQAMGKTSDYCK